MPSHLAPHCLVDLLVGDATGCFGLLEVVDQRLHHLATERLTGLVIAAVLRHAMGVQLFRKNDAFTGGPEIAQGRLIRPVPHARGFGPDDVAQNLKVLAHQQLDIGIESGAAKQIERPIRFEDAGILDHTLFQPVQKGGNVWPLVIPVQVFDSEVGRVYRDQIQAVRWHGFQVNQRIRIH
ncbi:hypothetical protein D3C85_1376500 [compost metagenome]